MTTAETAWTEAMKYENRHDPYRFFDELRKTPVVQVADKVYVVTGYRELLQLAHDPHVSSDMSKSPISAQPAADAPDVGADHMQAYGREPSLIVSDPAKHDKQRRQVMRHFAPPHSPNVIPNMAADIQTLCDELLEQDQGQGRQHLRRGRRLRLSGAGGGDLQDPRCAVEGRTHLPRLDLRLHGGRRHGPGRRHRRRAGPQAEGQGKHRRAHRVHGRPDPGVPDGTAGQRAVQVGERHGRAGRADDPERGCGQRDAAADRRS